MNIMVKRQYTSLGLRLLGLLLMMWIVSPISVDAKPPLEDDLPPSTGGQSAGSRGCNLHSPGIQQVIPPLSITHTNSTTPTLAWTGKSAEDPILEFRIFEYDAGTKQSQLVVETLNPVVQNFNGLSILKWPESIPPLKPDTQYIWQVEISCDPNRPSGNIFADAPLRTLSTAQPTDSPQMNSPYPNQKTGYDTLARILESNRMDKLQSYISLLQRRADMNLAWEYLMGNSDSQLAQ